MAKRLHEIPWKTEAELCATFTELATAAGWTVYPECSDWDLIAVRDGIQIGVEAKLKPNLEVLDQALQHIIGYHDFPKRKGPDFAAVLVPWADAAYRRIAGLCGVTAIAPLDLGRKHGRTLSPGLPSEDYWEGWHPLGFGTPCWLPPYVPDLPAGVPAPVKLTRWKVEAVRLCVLLRAQGYITTADIKAAGLSPTHFTHTLLQTDGTRVGKRHYRYTARDGVKLPDEVHPDIAEKIRAEGKLRPGPDQPEIPPEAARG